MSPCGKLLSALLTWCAVGALGQRPTPSKRHDVYIAGFFPFGGRNAVTIPEGQLGRGVMPAVKLAVDHINENSLILRNYRLHVWWNDTEVRPRFVGLFNPYWALQNMLYLIWIDLSR